MLLNIVGAANYNMHTLFINGKNLSGNGLSIHCGHSFSNINVNLYDLGIKLHNVWVHMMVVIAAQYGHCYNRPHWLCCQKNRSCVIKGQML